MRTAQLSLNILDPDNIEVTATSMITGKQHTMKLPITFQQFLQWEEGGETIQEVFPHLTPSQREFLMTGITDEEWDKYIKEPEE